ncbi:ABC transporter ATP-binding protein [Lacrimispora sp. NSJ-141]|uniref:ABC transporter ATP-binding protein n=1 Tax=Lientehia hominis TaxID=2897778 RepID=A0AAP2RJ29_9FIRM|nr:ABC transporter ATP-binding protein [Lientehia hominis]MCD2491835.1 ABC transporter ATP-binding protein [Lientehia hominis]
MLEVKNITVAYGSDTVVKDVSFAVKPGEVIGIVGESGSGKSTVLKSILGLLDSRGKVLGGEILLNGENLLGFTSGRMRQIRGKEIAMVFQHPELSLDPVWPVGRSFYESIRVHREITKKEAAVQGRKLLEALELGEPDKILSSYPFELSGGMCQRAAIAIAMANRPGILLADEPTSALDVTVQKQVIETMMQMRKEFSASILIVSHNIGVIAKMADFVGVMRRGQMVEWGTKEEVLYSPEHDYTKALIRAVPKMGGELPAAAEEVGHG